MAEEDATVPGLAVSGLGCMRGGKVLFRDLGFQLARGQALVVQGANGAGKSTLLRSLAGLQPWRAGQLQWNGQTVAPSSDAYRQQLAYLGHHSGMSDALSGLENLRFGLALMDVPWDGERVQQVLQALALQGVAQRAVGRLSQGQRRRLGLARVWLSERKLWLLDEPDNSLDDEGSQCLAQLLVAHLQAGGMAVVVTHRGLSLPAAYTQRLALAAQTASAPAQPCREVAAC